MDLSKNLIPSPLKPPEATDTSDKPANSSANTLSTTDASSADDPCRKKSGFLITRIDRASISSILENESDMENDYGHDRRASCRSPGSNSVISESSGPFDDGSSISEKGVPSIAIQTASPIISSLSTEVVAVVGSKHRIAPLAILQEQQTTLLTSVSSQSSSKDMLSSTASSTSSRFHIIKLDTGPYKRGRWNCRDYDESCSSPAIRSDMISVGPRSAGSSCSSGRNSCHVAEEDGKSDGTQTPVLTSTTTSENVQQKWTCLDASSTSRFMSPSGVNFRDAAAVILDTMIAGQNDHFLRSDLQFSAGDGNRSVALGTVTESETIQNVGTISAGSGGAAAIDNKIEQAMDLVKSHLLYAVREEVELMKEKIVELEKKVYRLESENKFLREYVPPEILLQIQLQSGGVQSSNSSLTQPQIGAISISPDLSISSQQPGSASSLDNSAVLATGEGVISSLSSMQ